MRTSDRLWLKGPSITVALAVTMLGMGLTLDLKDFVDAVKRPTQVRLQTNC